MALISTTDLERLNYGAPGGCIATGLHREVIKEAVATRTLLGEESGALCFWDVAAGVTFTLPAPVKGMNFTFAASIIGTGTYKVITNAATVFLIGAYMVGDATVASSGDVFSGDGTSHVSVTIDSDTKGRLVGGALRFTALSATQWYVDGMVIGTGTTATAFATT